MLISSNTPLITLGIMPLSPHCCVSDPLIVYVFPLPVYPYANIVPLYPFMKLFNHIKKNDHQQKKMNKNVYFSNTGYATY